MGKWAKTPKTLINKGLARGHFSKKSGQMVNFFDQKVGKAFFNRCFAQKKWAEAHIFDPKVGRILYVKLIQFHQNYSNIR